MTGVACRLWFPILKPSCVFVFFRACEYLKKHLHCLGRSGEKILLTPTNRQVMLRKNVLKNNEFIPWQNVAIDLKMRRYQKTSN
jgi:hypothetical protein